MHPTYELVKLRQQELLRDAEHQRLAARVNRPEQSTDRVRRALRLRAILAH